MGLDTQSLPQRRPKSGRNVGKSQRDGERRAFVPAGQEKLLPQNVEAEIGALGAILIASEAIAELAQFLKPDDFYREAHRTIYQAALDLYEAGGPADFITICDELGRRGKLEEVGGTAFVGSLANQVPTSNNAVHYGRIVQRTAIHRRLIHAAGQVAGVAYNEPDTDVAMEQAEKLIADVRQSMPATDGPRFLDDDELDAVPPARGILGNILYEQSFAVLFGPSGRWKTFAALSMALSVATGRAWFGRPAAEGEVFYVAAEGGRGIRKRVRAWKQRHGVTGKTRLHTLLAPVNLLDPAGVAQLVAQIRAKSATPAMVVFDTLSRCMPGGDENGGKDGSAAVAAVDAIKNALGCTVLVVAHPGKDEARGIRGWSGYFAAADTVIRMSGGGTTARMEPGMPVTLSCDKPKDSEPFQDITLTAEVERWGTEEGEIESSLVLVACNAESVSEDAKLTPKREAALAVLRAAPDGLTFMEWQRQSGMSKSTFDEAVKAFKLSGQVEHSDDGIYTAVLASSVGPVRSGLQETGPSTSGPVRSGVSIDTGQPDHAPDRFTDEHNVRPGEKIAAYTLRMRPLGISSEEAVQLFYQQRPAVAK